MLTIIVSMRNISEVRLETVHEKLWKYRVETLK